MKKHITKFALIIPTILLSACGLSHFHSEYNQHLAKTEKIIVEARQMGNKCERQHKGNRKAAVAAYKSCHDGIYQILQSNKFEYPDLINTLRSNNEATYQRFLKGNISARQYRKEFIQNIAEFSSIARQKSEAKWSAKYRQALLDEQRQQQFTQGMAAAGNYMLVQEAINAQTPQPVSPQTPQMTTCSFFGNTMTCF